jgi:superfamily II DNA or RNA helicase
LPRGCLDAAQALLRDNGIRCELRDERYGGESLEAAFAGQLRPDQQSAVAEMLSHDVGVLCAPTAFGKTVTAAAMIANRGVNTLVLVHRTELLKQWQARLQSFLGVGKGMTGTIGGGKANKPTGKIDIAVMQSLSRQGEVNPLVENYGHVIVDECHHVGAVSFDAILKRTKAKYVLGLTATPIRRDGQQPIIFMQCGPIRHTAAKPVGAPHDLEVAPYSLHTCIDLPLEAGIQDVFRHLANDRGRTAAIVSEIGRTFSQGRKVLVLTERTDHLDAISAALDGEIPQLFVLHGRMSRKQRATLIEELDALPPEAPRVLLATGRLVGEGVRPSTAGYSGAGDAGVVERHFAAVCRPAAPGACQQDRRSDHRFRGHGPPGTAADVGQAPARIRGHGVSNRRMTRLHRPSPTLSEADLLKSLSSF